MKKEDFQKIYNEAKKERLKREQSRKEEIVKVSIQKGITIEEAQKLIRKEFIEEIRKKHKEFEQEEILKVSKKRHISVEEAEKLIKEEKELNKRLEIEIISNGLKFHFKKEKILEHIDPTITENKRRIRYIIQDSLSKINSQYRDVFRFINSKEGYKHSKKLYKTYKEEKHKIWALRYRTQDYYTLLSKIFEDYLNKCFVIFFEYLLMVNKINIYSNKDFTKEEILKSIMGSPFLKIYFEQVEKIQNELEAKFEEEFESTFGKNEIENDSSSVEDYESMVMQALANGEGHLYGFD